MTETDETRRELALNLCKQQHAVLAESVQRPCPDCRAALRIVMEELVEECAEKHCGEPPTLGLTIRYADDLRVEIYLCERHFDAMSDHV